MEKHSRLRHDIKKDSMKNKAPILLALSAVLAFSSQTAWSQDPQPDPQRFKAHLTFLADDLLEGREAGSRGFNIAALYVASQFAALGVQAKGDPGSYLQTVPLRSSLLAEGSAQVDIVRSSGTESLTYLDDFLLRGSLQEDQSSLSAPLVFVGYGIQAERFGHNDYANLDVKGKIVVTLAGRPARFPTEEGAHFGNANHKRSIAAQHGAVGLINLATLRSERTSPFAKARDYRSIPGMTWVAPNGLGAHQIPGFQDTLSLSPAAAHKLFTQVDVKLDDILAAAEADKPLPHLDLNLSVKMRKNSQRAELKSSNVVGMIEGSDAQLKNEYVVFSAHLDHLGIVKNKTGDNLYNGAMDNASGVSTLLEMARLITQMPRKPKRSILFIALTGEEKGLLGSDYFATNPSVPQGAIVANVNLDMPLLTFDFKNVVAFGSEHSSLRATVAQAVQKMNMAVLADPWPEEGLFTRSDQYSFVKQGIPAIALKTGMDSYNKDEQPGKMWAAFRATIYHQPNDDLNLPFNFAAAARFVQVNFNIGVEIANDPQRPSWNKGDFFGDTFKK